MRRATITVPDELDRALSEFMAAQAARPSLTSVVEAALVAYLGQSPASEGEPSRLLDVVRSRQQISQIVEAHGGERVGLFGSVAEGRDGADSDIDMWVELRPDATLFDLAQMRADLEALLGATVDLVTLGGLDDEARSALVARSLVL